MALSLLQFEACPYCVKVKLALRRMGLDCESVTIDPADRGEVQRVSGQRLVPVLRDGDRVIPDSTRILRYLIARYGERGLLPAGPAEQALSWIVEDYADEVLGPLVYAVLEDETLSGRPLDARARKELEKHLETQFRNLEQMFAERPFVFGAAAGLADISLYAFLSRMVRSGRREISSGFPHLKAWYSRADLL
ncbi:MAG TPA: glutathione S-transferase family protein [Candidatus Polarisedimenticolia bacterium]|nr:glutathione S-transferase family protein [Candidatus Polarisedimenticolia bacterium]